MITSVSPSGIVRHEPDSDRRGERDEAEAQWPAAERDEIELEPGEEEEERHAELREHLDRFVRLDPAEQRRSHEDPGQDLDHRPGSGTRGKSPSTRGITTASSMTPSRPSKAMSPFIPAAGGPCRAS